MSEDNTAEFARQVVTEIVCHQITEDRPPEVRQHLERLIKEGYLPEEAICLIESALSREMSNCLGTEKSFEVQSYLAALAVLPAFPDH